MHPFFSELRNGSILHRRLGKLYDLGHYEILHFDDGKTQRRQYKVCTGDTKGPLLAVFQDPASVRIFQIATIVSMIFVGMHIFIYTTLKDLRDLPGQILLSMAVAMFPVQLITVVGGLEYSRSRSICIFIGVLLHYFQLVAGFWFNVASFDVCLSFLTINKPGNPKRKFKLYSLYAWGFPATIIALAQVSEHLSHLEEYRPAYAGSMDHQAIQLCWLNNRLGFGMFFALPIATLILENIVFYLISLICVIQEWMMKNSEIPREIGGAVTLGEGESVKKRFFCTSALGFVLTANWAALIIAIYSGWRAMWHALAVAHALQGIILFILFDIKANVYYMAYQKIVGKQHSAMKLRRRNMLSAGHQPRLPPDEAVVQTESDQGNSKLSEMSTAKSFQIHPIVSSESLNEINQYERIKSLRQAFSSSGRNQAIYTSQPLTSMGLQYSSNLDPRDARIKVRRRRSRSARNRLCNRKSQGAQIPNASSCSQGSIPPQLTSEEATFRHQRRSHQRSPPDMVIRTGMVHIPPYPEPPPYRSKNHDTHTTEVIGEVNQKSGNHTKT